MTWQTPLSNSALGVWANLTNGNDEAIFAGVAGTVNNTEGTLYLRLGGTCHGCAASTITLKQGIEVRLRQAVPEVKLVQAI